MADHNVGGQDFNNNTKHKLKSSTIQYSAVPKADGADYESAERQHGTWMQRVTLDT